VKKVIESFSESYRIMLYIYIFNYQPWFREKMWNKFINIEKYQKNFQIFLQI